MQQCISLTSQSSSAPVCATRLRWTSSSNALALHIDCRCWIGHMIFPFCGCELFTWLSGWGLCSIWDLQHHITFNMTVSPRHRYPFVTRSPDQPEQIKCDLTMGISMVSLNFKNFKQIFPPKCQPPINNKNIHFVPFPSQTIPIKVTYSLLAKYDPF